jgi:hypothetical protein
VIVRHHLFKAERIKQLSLVLLQPTHHGSFPPLTASTTGNHRSRKPSTDFCNKKVDGKTLRRYWTTACQGCVLKGQCTTGNERRLSSRAHEAVLEAVQARLDRNPDKMRLAARPSSTPSAR